ncbi:phospholysine phosphohistidine inorganic pyrophosphate phosphatase isoform X1 [Saccopteryx bilineata]|uniref:phospholysine phosphohistidine inorganic pyrophosphate phosphatase isoform X1 n=1 Tax=Saccopteryx bilineata TaxID=59482 RepID=UPI00338D450A
MATWGERLAGVRGVMLDISGVLYDSGEGGGKPITGSVEAVARLQRSGLKVRFCTNESQKSRKHLVAELRRLGFDISEGEVTSPPPAACLILKKRGLRPHLLVHDEVRSEFAQIDTSNPNCVVIADAGDNFSYQNMNKAFQVLMGLENPVLISLGKGCGAFVSLLMPGCSQESCADLLSSTEAAPGFQNAGLSTVHGPWSPPPFLLQPRRSTPSPGKPFPVEVLLMTEDPLPLPAEGGQLFKQTREGLFIWPPAIAEHFMYSKLLNSGHNPVGCRWFCCHLAGGHMERPTEMQ